MNNEEIEKHIRTYYNLLFDRKIHCDLNIIKGKELAFDLGYSPDLINSIPEDLWHSFLPCGNPLDNMKPSANDQILNLGSGVGIDSAALFLSYGSSVRIVNLDIVYNALKKSKDMMSKYQGIEKSIKWVCADASRLPFSHSIFDFVIMNGVFNLFPNKQLLIDEIRRIIKPNGSLIVTDLACYENLNEDFRNEPDAWAWCMSGALTKNEITLLLQSSGFNEISFNQIEMDNTFYRTIFTCRYFV